jgi:glycosyltransferase involved in cell wall biosynthesis
MQSVLAQTFTDYELIVVDDGSDDGTPDLLSRYGDKVKSIVQPNLGVSAARNSGIRNSNGELLAFLDSDDEWLPNKLMKQVALFRRENPFFYATLTKSGSAAARRFDRKTFIAGRVEDSSYGPCDVA